MNHIEAMKQALETLEQWNTPLYKRGIVIQSLRQAIAEAEKQEPVALQMDVIVVNLVREGINKHRARELAEHFIKYTHPQPKREWVGLTDEEHTKIAVDAGCMSADWVFYGAAVERALKKKNT